MKRFFCDLISGWETTVKKWSVQINALQAIVLAWLYLIDMPKAIIMIVLLVMIAAAIVAANLTQKTVATVDPTKVDVMPKDTPDAENT